MTKQESIESSLSDYHPLALDTWSLTVNKRYVDNGNGESILVGDSSFSMAQKTVEEAVDFIECDVRRSLALRALLATVTDQAARNHRSNLPASMFELYGDAVAGDSSQAKMIAMLHDYPVIGSMEVARRTHYGIWNVQDKVDRPVRASLDSVPDTGRVYEEPRYKIKIFDDDGAMVERKRTIRKHYGGKILTIVRNCMLVDYHSSDMPDELLEYMIDEQKTTLDRTKDYDYTQESTMLHGALEQYVGYKGELSDGDKSQEPDWVVPFLTTYYSTYADKVDRRDATQ